MKNIFQKIDTNFPSQETFLSSFTPEERRLIKRFFYRIIRNVTECEKLYYFSGYSKKYKLYIALQKSSPLISTKNR